MKPTEKPRGIIVGTGRAGTLLQRAPFAAAGADIVAYVDTDTVRAEKAARKYGVPHHHSDLTEALTRHRVDFVSVCTPSDTHAAVAATALAAGCHVLVEKPLTRNMAEAERLKEAADRAGKTVCTVHNHKFFSGFHQAAAICRSGGVGKIIRVERHMTFSRDRVRMMEPGHWAHRIPGGRLFEANPHNLYLLHTLVGDMKLVGIVPTKTGSRWPHAAIDGFAAALSAGSVSVGIHMSLNCESPRVYRPNAPIFMMILGSRRTMLATGDTCIFLDEVIEAARQRRSAPRAMKRALNNLIQTANRHLRRARSEERTAPSVSKRGEVIGIPHQRGTGHFEFIERYIGFLSGKYGEPPTSWHEAYETQRLNLEMGMAVDAMCRPETE